MFSRKSEKLEECIDTADFNREQILKRTLSARTSEEVLIFKYV
jgi:hypothetical protein